MLLLSTLISLLTPIQDSDSIKTYEIEPVTVTASLKHNEELAGLPVSATSFSGVDFDNGRISGPKDLSLAVPNLLQPDYGSRMTSSIYVRGIGSRMDQPAVGLYVDNVPVMNKNNYDFDYFDLQSIDVLRGPQGTLYGRNTIGGLIDVHTLSPFAYQGTRMKAGYGNGNTSTANLSAYRKHSNKFAYSIALDHRYSDGFYTNEYNGNPADRLLSEGARIKVEAKPGRRLTLENTLSASYVKQGGFAYGLYDETSGKTLPVDHNDPCRYNRFSLTNGLVLRYETQKALFSSVTSYQYMDDEMTLDQDFTPVSMFTLTQAQREHAVTQEFVARSAGAGTWQWTAGLFGFYKHTDMSAPVTFKREGIDQLILANANAGIHTVFPGEELLVREERFPIESDFRLPGWGASAYHQSSLTVGKWKFVAGIRADYERASMRYDNSTLVHYRFTMTMPSFAPLPVTMAGRKSRSFFEVTPKAAVMFETGKGNIYASVSRGYKSGGFNTQIFSDIIQNRMMAAMMADLGIYFGGYQPGYDAETVTAYKPEHSWNYEVGAHFDLLDGDLYIEPTLFFIDCRNQQLTVFPAGKTTGRLMSNAGRSRSMGAEVSAGYRYRDLSVNIAYGHTRAEFVKYRSGNDNYRGNRVPYSPANTISATLRYGWDITGGWLDRVSAEATWQGMGKTYWDEANTIAQPFYGLLNASLSVTKGAFTLGAWARNITGTQYNTFYFRSVGNSFMQRGKPFQMGISLNINLDKDEIF